MAYGNSSREYTRTNAIIETEARLRLAPPIIEHIAPEVAGPLAVMFLALSTALLERAKLPDRAREVDMVLRARYDARTISERLERALEAITGDVNTGSTLKQAVESQARSHRVAVSTLYQAVHMSARHNKSIRRVEIDRLIEMGWPDARIADYLTCHRSTVWKHRRKIKPGELPAPPAPPPRPQPR